MIGTIDGGYMTVLMATTGPEWLAATAALGTFLGVAATGAIRHVRQLLAEPETEDLRRAQAEKARAEAEYIAAQERDMPLEESSAAIRASAEALRVMLAAFPEEIARYRAEITSLRGRIADLEAALTQAEHDCGARIARLYTIMENRK